MNVDHRHHHCHDHHHSAKNFHRLAIRESRALWLNQALIPTTGRWGVASLPAHCASRLLQRDKSLLHGNIRVSREETATEVTPVGCYVLRGALGSVD